MGEFVKKMIQMTNEIIEIDEEEKKKFTESLKEITKEIDIHHVKPEDWYQSLLSKSDRTHNEELIFQIMDYTRETFNKIHNDMSERRKSLELPEDLKKKFESEGFNIKPRYYDWNSRPMEEWEYHFKHGYFDNHVDFTIVKGWEVSTVWLGLDHAFLKSNSPVIFETMIFKKDENVPTIEALEIFQDRYSYYDQALRGHEEACAMVDYLTSLSLNSPKENG